MIDGVEILSHRPRAAHKGVFGHLLVVAGGSGLTGAAGLAATAALRTGAGLVTLATPASLYPILASRFTEVMFLPLPHKNGFLSEESLPDLKEFLPRVDAVLLGPGLGRTPSVQKTVIALLPQIKIPLILDADGLNAIAGKAEILKKGATPVILTPHPGEMARLTGKSTEEIQAQRRTIATQFSRDYGVITVLKGYQTVVADPEGTVYLNLTGNPGMATAGSGDVLAGIMAGLLVQKIAPFTAAKLATYLHGLAGDIAAREKGEAALIASDILKAIPAAILYLIDCI